MTVYSVRGSLHPERSRDEACAGQLQSFGHIIVPIDQRKPLIRKSPEHRSKIGLPNMIIFSTTLSRDSCMLGASSLAYRWNPEHFAGSKGFRNPVYIVYKPESIASSFSIPTSAGAEKPRPPTKSRHNCPYRLQIPQPMQQSVQCTIPGPYTG